LYGLPFFWCVLTCWPWQSPSSGTAPSGSDAFTGLQGSHRPELPVDFIRFPLFLALHAGYPPASSAYIGLGLGVFRSVFIAISPKG
jgi:hypothetical protein